jgi:ArsR family transcriptional regulator
MRNTSNKFTIPFINFFGFNLVSPRPYVYNCITSNFIDTKAGNKMKELTVLKQKTPNQAFKPLAGKFKALSDEKRLHILYELRRGQLCVCDLQDALDLPQSSLSYHLKILVDAGLIFRETRGTWSYYELNTEGLGELVSTETVNLFRSK